jgi:hypothetical protein
MTLVAAWQGDLNRAIDAELTCLVIPKRGGKVVSFSNMTSGQWWKRIYGRERREKKPADGAPGGGAMLKRRNDDGNN